MTSQKDFTPEIIIFNKEVNRRMSQINRRIDSMQVDPKNIDEAHKAFMGMIREYSEDLQYINGFSKEFIQSSKTLLPRATKTLNKNLLVMSQRIMEMSDIYGSFAEFREITMTLLRDSMEILGKIGI